MKYIVRVTDGRCFRDIEIETDQGVEEAGSLAIDQATETQQWEIVETFSLRASRKAARPFAKIFSEMFLLPPCFHRHRPWKQHQLNFS